MKHRCTKSQRMSCPGSFRYDFGMEVLMFHAAAQLPGMFITLNDEPVWMTCNRLVWNTEEDHFYFLKPRQILDSGTLQVKLQISESTHQRILHSQTLLKFSFGSSYYIVGVTVLLRPTTKDSSVFWVFLVVLVYFGKTVAVAEYMRLLHCTGSLLSNN